MKTSVENKFFASRYFFINQFEELGWDVQDLTDGNCTCPIIEVSKSYPFCEGLKYKVICPNSTIDNVDNEEFAKFDVYVFSIDDEECDIVLEQQEFVMFWDVCNFIYGEE
jgi:hypothetical protein